MINACAFSLYITKGADGLPTLYWLKSVQFVSHVLTITFNNSIRIDDFPTKFMLYLYLKEDKEIMSKL